MARKFRGRLAKRVAPRRVNLLLSPAAQEEVVDQWLREDQEKMLLLCKEYEIEPNKHMYENLCYALARDFVPGFQEKKKTGRTGKWSLDHELCLLIDIDQHVAEHGVSITEAARFFASRNPWKSFLEPRDKFEPMPNPGEALRRKYNEINASKLAAIYRNSHAYDISIHGEDHWLERRLRIFAGKD